MESLVEYSSSDESDNDRNHARDNIAITVEEASEIGQTIVTKKPQLISAAQLFSIEADTIHVKKDATEQIILTVAPSKGPGPCILY